jgi:hypothetical protein
MLIFHAATCLGRKQSTHRNRGATSTDAVFPNNGISERAG